VACWFWPMSRWLLGFLWCFLMVMDCAIVVIVESHGLHDTTLPVI
jgi:hypothetical protein